MDSDTIMQGVVITSLAGTGLFAIAYCIWKKYKSKSSMKQSPSMEDLTSVSSEDPESLV